MLFRQEECSVRQTAIALIVSILMAFYSAFPDMPLFDCFRKFFPPENCVQVYQLAPNPDCLTECYVIKTANNKIIVIDGGIDGSGKESETYLPSAIRAILGLKKNDYFEVEAWLVSHAHSDHFYELAKMLREYTEKSNYKINNFYFDFPDIGVEWSSISEDDAELECMQVLYEGFDNYFRVNNVIDGSVTDPMAAYNSLNGKTITTESVNNGLTVTVDSVNIDVLLDWSPEDLIVNSTSVVFRLRYNEHSILFLGDSYTDTEKRLLEKYNPSELESEYVQLAHHGQNGTSREFYDAINAKNSIRLWASPQWLWNSGEDSPYQIAEVRTWMGLPADPEVYISEGCDCSGRDYVVGLYQYFPRKPSETSSWNTAVLDSQRVAVFH